MSLSPLANDDEILRRLAQAARQRRVEDVAEDSDLDRRTDEILASQGADAFGAAFQGSVVEAIRQGIAKEEEALPSESPPVGFPPKERALPSVQPWQPMALVAASLVMAVAISFYFGSSTSPRQISESFPSYPFYKMEPDGLQLDRSEGDPQGRIEVAPGFNFRVLLRPESAPPGPPEVRVFVGADSGRLERWLAAESKVEVHDSGVALLDGLEVEDWQLLTLGDWTVYFAVGRKGTLPSRAVIEGLLEEGKGAATTAGETASWQLLSQEIRLVIPP